MTNRAHNNTHRTARSWHRKHRKLIREAFMGWASENHPELLVEFAEALERARQLQEAGTRKPDLTVIRNSGLVVAKDIL